MQSWYKTLAAALLMFASLLGTDARAQNSSEKTAVQKSAGKHYVLPANKDTVQWGWYDPTEKPKLIVNSGDTVSALFSLTLGFPFQEAALARQLTNESSRQKGSALRLVESICA